MRSIPGDRHNHVRVDNGWCGGMSVVKLAVVEIGFSGRSGVWWAKSGVVIIIS